MISKNFIVGVLLASIVVGFAVILNGLDLLPLLMMGAIFFVAFGFQTHALVCLLNSLKQATSVPGAIQLYERITSDIVVLDIIDQISAGIIVSVISALLYIDWESAIVIFPIAWFTNMYCISGLLKYITGRYDQDFRNLIG